MTLPGAYDFLTWRVRDPATRALWSFLDVPFRRFPCQRPAVYQLDTEYPLPSLTAAWLMAQLHQQP